jgi:fatty-acid peroxygenase
VIPRTRLFDSSIPLLADGYRYLSRTADELGTDAFHTRVALQPVLCLRGADAARFFYEGGRFDRTASMPPTVKHLLQDNGSVQTLEDGAHRGRKSGFIELLQGHAEQRITGIAREEIGLALRRWRGQGSAVMHDELPLVFAAIALRWAGVPDYGSVVAERGSELWSMVMNAGSFGPANWAALLRRR